MPRRPDPKVPFSLLGVGALALLPLLVSSVATAQDHQPRVYIVSVPMGEGLDGLSARCGSAARAALREIPGVDWQTPDQRFLGYDAASLTVLSRAREQLEAGRQAYLQLELETAITQLQGAVENFGAAAAALEDPDDLGQALLFLGASHAFNDQRRAAMAVFRRLHTQMPHITPDPDTFPPDVVALFEQSTPRDARRPAGTISIDSNPPGAIAYVDFLARGRTPLNVDGLIGGEHVVRVMRPGATPFAETQTVRRGRTATSTATLRDNSDLNGLNSAIDDLALADVSEVGNGPIAQIATMLEVDKIGIIRVSQGAQNQVTLELLLFDVESGRRLVRGEGAAPTGISQLETSVQQAVTRAFEAALRPNQAGDTEAPPAVGGGGGGGGGGGDVVDPGPTRPITEEWWFWSIIGGVALAGLIAAIAIPLATQGPPLGNDRGGQVVIRF